MQPIRDHVFISYAVEDAALADWLARKLAAEGYAVWYDRLQLLGGEPWPKDIDAAIKTRTFRMLALLSRASVQKDNPSRERTTAQAVGKSLKQTDFLITLNVDGLAATEIPWTLSEINYIDFSRSWAAGLAAVLKKLDRLQAPRTLSGGTARAIQSVALTSCTLPQDERLWSNCLPVQQVPEVIHRYTTSSRLPSAAMEDLRRRWPCYSLSDDRFLSFVPPPADVQTSHYLHNSGGACWTATEDVDGVSSRDLVVALLRASLDCHLAARGLRLSADRRQWYVPAGLLPGNWLKYRRPDGSAARVLSVGTRTFRSGANRSKYVYHLSPSLVVRGSPGRFFIVIRNRVYLTTEAGSPLAGRQIVSRRKHLCKNWWNDDWLSRVRAVAQLLAGAGDVISIGEPEASQIIIARIPLSFVVPIAVDDATATPTPEEALPLFDEADEADDESV